VLRAQGNGNTSALDSDESDASVFGLRRAQRETEDCDELSEPPSQGRGGKTWKQDLVARRASSLYTTGMCASNALADNQGTIVCTSNLCVDGKVDDALLQAEGQIQ